MTSYVWTPQSIALLGTATDTEIAKQLGISALAVMKKRGRLGIAKFSKNYGRKENGFWTEDKIEALGKRSDRELSIEWKCSTKTVLEKRRALGIAAYTPPQKEWQDWEIELLGKAADYDVGKRIGQTRSAVTYIRRKLGIPAFQRVTRQQDKFFLGWEKFAPLSQPEIFSELKSHYEFIFGERLTYQILSGQSFYSVSRLQKWFTAGSAQQPLNIEKRHHFWLLAMHWGLRSERQ